VAIDWFDHVPQAVRHGVGETAVTRLDLLDLQSVHSRRACGVSYRHADSGFLLLA
jgi:hypothetical protein